MERSNGQAKRERGRGVEPAVGICFERRPHSRPIRLKVMR